MSTAHGAWWWQKGLPKFASLQYLVTSPLPPPRLYKLTASRHSQMCYKECGIATIHELRFLQISIFWLYFLNLKLGSTQFSSGRKIGLTVCLHFLMCCRFAHVPYTVPSFLSIYFSLGQFRYKPVFFNIHRTIVTLQTKSFFPTWIELYVGWNSLL
jgi:hypothetical protein